MDTAQIWTMIGAFTALMFGTLTVISTMFVRVLRSEIGGLRGEMNGRFDAVNARIDGEIGGLRGEMNGLRGEIGGLRGEMNARFDTMNHRIDGLDRGVQALVTRTFGLERDS